jgi:hypothetical protein
MDGMTRTKHFDQRLQQRGLNEAVVMALLQYGAARRTRDGAESLFFSKAAMAEIRSDCGLSVFKQCEKLRNAYLIVSDGVLVTVARSYRKIAH